jgi:replication initiation and membrane attachment protein DnaB
MVIKRVLRPERLRQVPAQFSWVDQRLLRDGYLQRCDAAALALYLLLVTVADAQGLSYYGDALICRLLSLQPQQLERTRRDLIGVGLIAYVRPLYQVLALEPPSPPRVPGVQPIQRALARLPALTARRTSTGA